MDEKEYHKYFRGPWMESLSQKEKVQFIVAFWLVILALVAFIVKIYFV